MACKDKCCCPVKRRPAKKRKSTVGKVSATQLLAQSIASLALPRRVNEPFLYGNSPLGEAQRYMKVAEPAKIENVLPKSMSVGSRFEPESVVAKTIQNVNKPLKEGRKTFTPASEVVSKPFNVEQISSTLTPNYLPGAVLPRASIEVPPMSMPLNNKMLNELSIPQRVANPSATNVLSSELLKKPQTIKQIIKTPTVIIPKFIPSLSSIKENVLYGTKSGTNELTPIAGGGAGMGGRPKKVEII